jgi:hypothetical protein
LHQAELAGLLDRIVGVLAGVGTCHHVSFELCACKGEAWELFGPVLSSEIGG